MGSPPLARERRYVSGTFPLYGRITPACAGKTSTRHASEPPSQDHPRLRGKDYWVANYGSGNTGSPPLARERHLIRREPKKEVRITPACAGKTSLYTGTNYIKWDHPRLRGKDLLPVRGQKLASGSPPLARERLLRHYPSAPAIRITPACAGKTDSDSVCRASSQDHPRLRGKDRIR